MLRVLIWYGVLKIGRSITSSGLLEKLVNYQIKEREDSTLSILSILESGSRLIHSSVEKTVAGCVKL